MNELFKHEHEMQSKWKNTRDRYLLHLKKRCFRYIMLFTCVLGNKYTKKLFTTFKILRNLSCLFSLFPRILSAAVGFLVYKWNSYHPKVSSLLCLFTFILVVILSVWNKIGVPSDRLLFWIRRKRLVWRNKSFQLCQLQCEINYFFLQSYTREIRNESRVDSESATWNIHLVFSPSFEPKLSQFT